MLPTCPSPAVAVAGWTDAYAAAGSGSDYDWQSPGGGDPWFLSDYDAGLGGAGLTGQRGAGGAADVVAGQMGAAVGDPNFGFDQLKSEDWSDQLVNEVGAGSPAGWVLQPAACWPSRELQPRGALRARRASKQPRGAGRLPGRLRHACGSPRGKHREVCMALWAERRGHPLGSQPPAAQVGEGNSFRREQRERYGVPLMNMTNLAHASEEELLVAAEAQVRAAWPAAATSPTPPASPLRWTRWKPASAAQRASS